MLNQYFSADRIINHICKVRVKQAGARHDRQYIGRLAGHITEREPDHPFYKLTPPRRLWAAFRPKYRKAGLNPDLFALKNAIRTLREREPGKAWVVALNHYIAAIRERVFNGREVSFSPPTINAEPKRKGGHEYRALSRFEVDDNLILCLFANYLRDSFDPLFSASSYAFRAACNGRIPTHHDAFEAVWKLKVNSGKLKLYVAECDIRGFFDTVDHGVAWAVFQSAAHEVNLHPRAELLFRAYLDCYSFPRTVLTGAEPELKRRDPKGVFKWPESDLAKLHSTNPRQLRIGVSQGGALSGIIANLILNEADKVVKAEGVRLGAEIHYYRFCDDMLLISPSRKHCKLVFAAYLRKLTGLKLIYHDPKRTLIYGKVHWDHKSKSPYLWSGAQWFGAVPWVQFVGYQIRYDGLVRPRNESVAKQCQKLVETTNQLKFGLIRQAKLGTVKATGMQALTSLQARLIAQGVGRIKGGETGPRPMCWAAGYKGLDQKPFIDRGLRSFDQARAKQIQRFDNIKLTFGSGVSRQSNNCYRPEGFALSYVGQFINLGGQNLIQHPWKPGILKERVKAWVFRLVKKLADLRRH